MDADDRHKARIARLRRTLTALSRAVWWLSALGMLILMATPDRSGRITGELLVLGVLAAVPVAATLLCRAVLRGVEAGARPARARVGAAHPGTPPDAQAGGFAALVVAGSELPVREVGAWLRQEDIRQVRRVHLSVLAGVALVPVAVRTLPLGPPGAAFLLGPEKVILATLVLFFVFAVSASLGRFNARPTVTELPLPGPRLPEPEVFARWVARAVALYHSQLITFALLATASFVILFALATQGTPLVSPVALIALSPLLVAGADLASRWPTRAHLARFIVRDMAWYLANQAHPARLGPGLGI